MFTISQLENILFIDIETAPVVASYADLPERMKPLWDRKAQTKYRHDPNHEDPAVLFADKAGIHAEFGRVVCISCGRLKFEGRQPTLTIKSYYGDDEHQILKDCGEALDKFLKVSPKFNLCAHNGKEFDFPYLGRRYLIHGLSLPGFLAIQGKKPWEVSLLDTMELWKFGDYKAYTSLELMAAVLGVSSSKGDIDGSQVGRVFWEEKDYERIKRYCERDVWVTAQVLLTMSRQPRLPEEAEHPTN
jgi:3'-5' exonuclease